MADQYYVGTFDNEYGEVKLDSSSISKNFFSKGVNMDLYGNQCGDWSHLDIRTAVSSISHTATFILIDMTTNLDTALPDEGFCFRNVQLLINPCHYSCKTCDGGLINNCLTCYDNSTPSSGKCPTCSNPNRSFQTSSAGCV